ncbi:MAG: GNAT family N-acetyltransferase [Liquorilactobacillus sp.]
MRILLDNKENTAKISPILILPEFQNQGLAQKSLIQIEKKFPDIKTWVLDTIKQEKKLVHLYLKAGYQIIDGKESRIQDGMNIIYFYKKV